MKYPIQACLLLSASLFLSGCVHYVWMKPGGDPSTFSQDNFQCKQAALNNAPPVFQTYGPYTYPYEPQYVRTYCRERGHHEVCRTHVSGPAYVGPPATVDLNARNREDVFGACMNALGWILQPVEDSP